MRKIEKRPFWLAVMMVFSGIPILIVIHQIFQLNLFGLLIIDNSYMYAMLAGYLSLVFLLYPAKGSSPTHKVPWYDIILFAITAIISVYFAFHGIKIRHGGLGIRGSFFTHLFQRAALSPGLGSGQTGHRSFHVEHLHHVHHIPHDRRKDARISARPLL